MIQSIKQFLSNGLVAYNSKLAKLLNVDIIVVLGIAFAGNDKSVYSQNQVRTARRQYAVDSLLLYSASMICIALLKIMLNWQPCLALYISILACTACFGYSAMYALSALISKRIANKAGLYDKDCWCSHYKLDQINNMYKVHDTYPASHWHMLRKAWTAGLKYKKQGWFVKVC